MSQYPRWFLLFNFPNILIAIVTMIFIMFGGVHPFGQVDSTFWNFLIYLLSQLLWLAPILLFFVSLLAWGYIREKIAIATGLAGWIINLSTIAIIFAS